MSVAVAISTVPERADLAADAARKWIAAGVDHVTVTQDADRRGVAWNKNQGIGRLMDSASVDHLFLADDDMYPLSREAWERYVADPEPHLMLCWGRLRYLGITDHGDGARYSLWKWPRGVLLYARRDVIEAVGGMREEFGTGGHEHVEWSRRIHQAGLTRHMFADLAQNPREHFYAEDMPRPGERAHEFQLRKRRHSTIRRTAADKRRIVELWKALDGSTDYVDYR